MQPEEPHKWISTLKAEFHGRTKYGKSAHSTRVQHSRDINRDGDFGAVVFGGRDYGVWKSVDFNR